MTIPSALAGCLRIPAVAAPMFLTSGPDLVVACSRSGVLGTFPALNPRSTEQLDNWLGMIAERLGALPFGVNLIVHKSNRRLDADLARLVAARVPVVITSLGAVRDLVAAVHAYGGLVFHDVINLRHAAKALEAGVDGIIAVAAGAGGHAGTTSPFALVNELRALAPQTCILLAGAMSTGRDIAAARVMGADLAYLGTRFIATQESMVTQEQKRMTSSATAADIVYTPKVSGVAANFLGQSLAANGLDPATMAAPGALDMGEEARAWKTIWSAGQGVGSVRDIPDAASLCARLTEEYRAALGEAGHDRFLA